MTEPCARHRGVSVISALQNKTLLIINVLFIQVIPFDATVDDEGEEGMIGTGIKYAESEGYIVCNNSPNDS